MRFATGAGLTLALAPLVLDQAHAAGFMVRENSAENVGMAYAGQASRADEAATVFNNPAGMMHLSTPEVELGAAVVFPSIHFSGSSVAAGVIPVTGTQGGQGGQTTGIPNFYAVFDLANNLRFGLAVTVPFGNTTNFKPGFVGRYQGIKQVALSADINPNVAWRINDKVSIGGGISAQWLKIEQSAAVPQFLIAQQPLPDTDFLLNSHGWGIGFNAGLLLEPNMTTRLGFTYRSGVDHKLTGSLDFDSADLIGLPSGAATVTGLNLPAQAAASFTHDWTPQWTGAFELHYDMWGSFKEVSVTSQNPPLLEPEFYRNSWLISAGAIYHWSDRLALRGGFGWDQSPVTDKFRTVNVPDADRLMVGAGAGFTVVPGAVVDFGYAHYFGTHPATVTGSVNSIDPFTRAIVLSGNFHNYLDYVALSFRYAL